MPDNVTPLAQVEDFQQTAFYDMAQNLQANELPSVMLQATRACESACRRRLAPFTVTETSRMDAGDMDEGSGSLVPLPMLAQMGMDYSRALGVGDMARHLWLREYPPIYQDMWTGSITSIGITWPYQSAPYAVGNTQWNYDVDTGHVRFLLGTFVPFGSIASVTYTGGYSTVPQDLVAACCTMAASMILNRLDPERASSAHDPGILRDEAIELLDPYFRD